METGDVCHNETGMESAKRRRLSMLRSYTVADLFTIGNATCGTIYPLTFIYALSGMGMISATIRIPKP